MNITLTCLFFVYFIGVHVFNAYIYLLYYYERFSSIFEGEVAAEYDYIIVGCGTAGSLISRRFDAQNFSYICLEAGGSGSSLFDIPAVGVLLHGSIHDWEYSTVEQKHACGAMNGKACNWPSGRIMGGSARLNNMIHLRGNTSEFVSWFNGRYDEDYFKRELAEIERSYLLVETLQFRTELADAVLRASELLGFPVQDLNERGYGFAPVTVNQRNGARLTTFHGTNTKHALTNAVVDKIIIDDNEKIARGVIYTRYGYKNRIGARKGVILSSGAVGSPKLLLLSGIGPGQHLRDLNINVIQDLNVGYNLQDHITTGLDLILINRTLSFDFTTVLNPLNSLKYLLYGTGPWTAPGAEAIALINEELELMVLPVGLNTDLGVHLKNLFNLNDDTWRNYFSKLERSVTILPVVLHPRSRGYVRLRSKNPHDKPIIDPKYLSDPHDSQILLDGIKFIMNLIDTEPMRSIGAHLNDNPFPGCKQFNFGTDDYWYCYFRQFAMTTFHPVGTCKMGDVVDYNFRVYGIKNLYVVDASVIPSLPGANTNTAVALMAHIFVNTLIDAKVCYYSFIECLTKMKQCDIY